MINNKKEQMKYLGIFFLCFFLLESNAQISPFGDSEGEAALQLIQYNSLILNAKESSFALGFAPNKYSEDSKVNWAVNLKASSKKGISNIVKSNEITLDGDLSIPISMPINKKRHHYFFLIPGIKFSKPNIYYPRELVKNQLKAENQLGYSLTFGYNNENLKDFIAGIALKAGQSDNSNLIDPLNVGTVKFNSTDSTGTSIATTEKTAFNTDEYNSSHSFFRLNIDFGNNLFSDRLIWLFQGSFKADESFKPLYNIGLGIYMNKDNEPFEIQGGIQLTFNDLSGNRTTDNFTKRIGLNFIAAIPLE